MCYSNQYKDIIADFGTDFKKGKKFDDGGIESAIKEALGDLMARTLKKKVNVLGYPNTIQEKFEKLDSVGFVDELKKYFSNPAMGNLDTFDDWHKKMCGLVTTALGRYYTNWAYGKSQKIVNMSLKYIYCLEGADKKEDYFTYCHMPLDRFILEWMTRNVFSIVKDNKGKKLANTKIESWSKLEDKSKNGQYSYSQLIGFIREYFNSQNEYVGLTMFQAEFYIWKEIQLHMALEGIYNQLVEDEKARKNFKKEVLKVKCDEALGKLDALKSILVQN